MKKIVVLLGIIFAGNAFPQTAPRVASIGYAYPAGGQKGTVVHVTVGGQNLRGVTDVYVSGEGVQATDVKYIPMLNALQRQELMKRLRAIREKHTRGKRPGRTASAAGKGETGTAQNLPKNVDKPSGEEKPVALPEHPLLLNLENLTPYEIKQVADIFLPFRRLQINRSIQEMVLVSIQIAPDAPEGKRELRLKTRRGLTNPVFFHVGNEPEISEKEPNGPDEDRGEVYPLPVVFNGQIMPGDADLFRFNAKKGQNLVIEAQARKILPYIADGVPGWFQAVLFLYDSSGREVAYADDYQFRPDPVIFYRVEKDGEYTLGIRDSIFRGREDFVYRVCVSEKPFITSIFPLGGRIRQKADISIEGWNLPVKSMHLDTYSGGGLIREAALSEGSAFSNTFYYAVDSLPEYFEKEDNGSVEKAEAVSLPATVNGRIAKQGDIDVFRLECAAGCEIAAEIYSRRLGSPLDSMLKLSDSSGRLLAWNDDSEDRADGLNTHHADSFLSFRAEESGTYFIRISDTQGQGGREYAYRLRLLHESPDFELRATPSAVNVHAGSSEALKIHVLRKRGFSEEIRLSLAGETHGFSLEGATIPAGKDTVYVTLKAPSRPSPYPVFLDIEGRSTVNGEERVRPLIAADEMMQAFAYVHLVPAEKLTVSVLRPRMRGLSMEIETGGPLKIPAGGSSKVLVSIRSPMEPGFLIPQLKEPPEGLSIKEVRRGNGTLSFDVKTDAARLKPGFADNLIVEVFSNIPAGRPDEKGERKKQKVSLGFLPAIPVEIIE